LATPSPGAALLAVVTPLLLFHVDYQPGFSLGAGATDVDVHLSDLLLALVAGAVAVRVARSGGRPLRAALPLWIVSGAFLAWIAASTLHPLLSDRHYDFGQHLITAAKFAEYAILAPAVVLLARRRDERELLLVVIAGWGALAAVVGLLQFVGVDIFDGWAAGRRQPSFLGHHDFAALAGCAFAIGLAALVLRRHRAAAAGALVAGAAGLVLSGSIAGLLGVVATFAVIGIAALRSGSARRPLAAAGAGVLVAALLLVALRGNDLDDFLRFTGVLSEQPQKAQGVETYSHRTLLAYLGLRIWEDHPVAGAGWQASGEYDVVAPYVPDAHRRFPDIPAEAFPVPGRRYGVQNAWVQSLADLGVLGFLLFGALLALPFWRAVRSARADVSWIALAVMGMLRVVAADWTAQGLVAALALDTLTWLGVGFAAALSADDR
jgi:O-antigen ligase